MVLARGYTTPDAVAELLGTTFTPEQESQADLVIAAAEDAIDAYTGRTWLLLSPAVEEWPVSGPFLTLRSMPILGVDLVETRPDPFGDYTALDPHNWVIWSAPRGTLRLATNYASYDVVTDTIHFGRGAGARVTYQCDPLYVPPAVQLAATQYASQVMQAAATGISGDVKSYTVGPYQTVERFDRATGQGEALLPPGVAPLLAPFKRSHLA